MDTNLLFLKGLELNSSNVFTATCVSSMTLFASLANAGSFFGVDIHINITPYMSHTLPAISSQVCAAADGYVNHPCNSIYTYENVCADVDPTVAACNVHGIGAGALAESGYSIHIYSYSEIFGMVYDNAPNPYEILGSWSSAAVGQTLESGDLVCAVGASIYYQPFGECSNFTTNPSIRRVGSIVTSSGAADQLFGLFSNGSALKLVGIEATEDPTTFNASFNFNVVGSTTEVAARTFAFSDDEYDLNNDGRFNSIDVDYLTGNLDSDDTAFQPVDINANGVVDSDDIASLQELVTAHMDSGLLGDYDQNGVVDCDDLGAVVSGDFSTSLSATNYRIELDANLDGVIDSSDEAIVYKLWLPADFNGDHFVNGDDYDEFVDAFGNSDISADFNGDSFVTGDDFDGFVDAFENSC